LATNKRVQTAPIPIDFEEELGITSNILEAIRDQVVEAEQQVRAVETRIQDAEGWVQDLRRRGVQESKRTA